MPTENYVSLNASKDIQSLISPMFPCDLLLPLLKTSAPCCNNGGGDDDDDDVDVDVDDGGGGWIGWCDSQ